MKSFIIHAPAKVNLFLHIISKKTNLHHEIESLVVFTNFCDKIYFEENDTLEIHFKGPMLNDLPGLEDNIIYKAALILMKKHNIKSGAKILVEKKIPVAAGLGGGSSNAVAVIRGLSKLWGIDVNENDILNHFLCLGTDIPVCFRNETSLVKGIGDICVSVNNFPNYFLLLVNPKKKLETKKVYSTVDLSSCYRNEIELTKINQQVNDFRNDLCPSAKKIVPDIGLIIKELKSSPGCIFARLSGSGPTCFGVFDTKENSEKASKNINKNFDWWTMPTYING